MYFETYENDVLEGNGAEWIDCACGRWLHLDCAEDHVVDSNGKELSVIVHIVYVNIVIIMYTYLCMCITTLILYVIIDFVLLINDINISLYHLWSTIKQSRMHVNLQNNFLR